MHGKVLLNAQGTIKLKVKHLLFEKLNVSKRIANHLIGEEHTPAHRITVGGVIALCGMIIIKSVHEPMLLSFFSEFFGVTLHAIGAIPLLETISKKRVSLPGEQKVKDGQGNNLGREKNAGGSKAQQRKGKRTVSNIQRVTISVRSRRNNKATRIIKKGIA